MFRPGLEKLTVYSVEEPRWNSKLDANERSAILPLSVRREISRRIKEVESRRYPDMGAVALRTMLAETCGVSLSQVTLGNGSSELVAAICGVFGGAGRAIAFQWPSFSMYPIYAAMADSPSFEVAMEKDFSLSVDAVLQTVSKCDAKLLILCNPNNPTGGTIPSADLREILRQVSCPVLVDEAYQEYFGKTSLSWLKEFPNLMVARTFSKAFGLAAARVGYLLASPELSAAVCKHLLPYHMNSFSLAAAEVCFANRDKVMEEVRRTSQRRDRMKAGLEKMKGVEVFPSSTNFLLLRVEDPAVLYKLLAENGIGVRNVSRVHELEGCLRVTVGSPAENRKVMHCISEYVKSATGTKGEL